MKTYWIYYWMENAEGAQVAMGHETMTDGDAAKRAAMAAARRGYHANVISNGRKVYAQ